MGRKALGVAALALLVAMNAVPPALLAEPARAAVRPQASGESLLGDFSLSKNREPISVRSDELEFSYHDRVLTYRGKVEVTQADLTLRSDKLTIRFTDTVSDRRQNVSERLQEVVAEGNVQIIKGTRSAHGDRAVFNQRDRTVQLSENAVLNDGPNRVTGERVVVYLDEERFVVEGGDQRVQAVLYPDKGLAGATAGSGHTKDE